MQFCKQHITLAPYGDTIYYTATNAPIANVGHVAQRDMFSYRLAHGMCCHCCLLVRNTSELVARVAVMH